MIKYYDFFYWNRIRNYDNSKFDIIAIKMDEAGTDLEKII